MGPYSHIVIANELESFIKPENKKEYYLGAVAPDVRYLKENMPRKQTHFSYEKILNYLVQYPDLKDFLNGYLIHCLTDKLSIKKIIGKRFPFILLKSRITKSNSAIILEFLNIWISKPFDETISQQNNPVLKEIGIDNKDVDKFTLEINKYIKSRSTEYSFQLYQNLGFTQDRRIEKYKKLHEQWQRSWFKNNLKFLAPQLRKVNEDIAYSIKQQISKIS
jgi:hypothetical protein